MSRGLVGLLGVLASRRAWSLAWLFVLGIAVAESHDIWLGPAGRIGAVIELMFYWGAWLLFPGCIVLGMNVVRRARRRQFWRTLRSLVGLVLCLAFIWGRFIEANRLVVHESSMPLGCGVKVALISDLHIGLFTRQSQLEAVVERLNQLDVDAVLIAGDFSYQPDRDLQKTFAPLAKLKLKPYAVLGNHDTGGSGAPELAQPLRETLTSLGVKLIEAKRVPLGRCELNGVGSYLADLAEDDLTVLAGPGVIATLPPATRVMLTHEPETLRAMPRGYAAGSLAGHTHGGQISIPGLGRSVWRRLLPGGWVSGPYVVYGVFKLFVTSGIGTDHLPVRIGMPPVIDVLNL